jgi:hypothetical protein
MTSNGALALLSRLAEGSYDPRMLAGERVQAAVALLADGGPRRPRGALDLAATGCRDPPAAHGSAGPPGSGASSAGP